jgi:hypothetical protein
MKGQPYWNVDLAVFKNFDPGHELSSKAVEPSSKANELSSCVMGC